ncbi:unnamed protein product [Nesidiocoris tenuis]|uniref:Uncharacterized protein n=1 Tax=Nesidiocoris tenuis TaxID=355587 RepID=A0A6H5FUR7_9HEMI|nr:unnamed protein product [Nesidiocoris tenuis]
MRAQRASRSPDLIQSEQLSDQTAACPSVLSIHLIEICLGLSLLHQQGDALTLRPVALGNIRTRQALTKVLRHSQRHSEATITSMPAVQYTKSFITSVVLGKDVVPRIGLYQMEALRADLINAIKRSKEPKGITRRGFSSPILIISSNPEYQG